jgi:Zn-dependent peptidase ImmA (M78 family)
MKFRNKNNTNSSDKELIRKIKTPWGEREKGILDNINQITGLSINTEKIICYIDNKTTHGFYGSRTIYLGVKGGITKDDALMVISHELFHVFYWRKIKKMKLTTSSPGNESKIEWKLAEVAAFLLTNESLIRKNWPNAKVYLYPEIKEVYKKVKKFWKKGNIGYFLVNSYKTINK